MAIARTLQGGTSSDWAASLSVTLVGCTAGRLIAVATQFANGSAAPLASQISGSNIGAVTLAIGAGDSPWPALFWTTVTANGDCTITYTPPASGGIAIVAAEYSGADTTAPVDGTGWATAWGTAVATGNLAPAGNAVYVGSCGSTYDSTQDGAYSLIYENSGSSYWVNTCDLVGSGTKSISWTQGTTGRITCVGAAFKEAAVGGLSIPVAMQNMRGGFGQMRGGFCN